MIKKVKELIKFLNNERPNMAPYTFDETLRYYKIITQNRSAHCFVVKEDFINKSIGSVKKGDLLFPKTWSQPSKHPRGKLFERKSWDKAFDKWSMRYLR